MSDVSPLRLHASLIVTLAVVVVLPAVWSFGSAIHSAFSTGEVLVISLGRYETHREWVPWTQGWARFAAPPMLVLSLLLVGASSRAGRGRWVGAVLSLVALALLFYSAWFTSVAGAVSFMGMSAFIVLCFYIDRRFGRIAAFGLMLAAVLLAVFSYAPR